MIPADSTVVVARRAALAFALAMLSTFPASTASAQCTVLSGPTAFDPPASGLQSHFRSSANSLGLSPTAGRLAVRYNYGFVVYGLAAPGAPNVTSIEDLMVQDGYPKSGDGQSRTGPIALSADGQRILVPWTDTTDYGTIAQAFGSSSFGAGGDYPPGGYDTFGNAVGKVGSRYLAFTGTLNGLYVADVTDVAGGPGPSVRNGIPSERVATLGTDLTSLQFLQAEGSSLLVGRSSSRVAVVDVSSPGGAVPSLSASFTVRNLTPSALGVPAGNAMRSVAAAAHPVDGSLYLLVEAAISSSPYTVSKVILNRVEPASTTVTKIGEYTPPSGENIPQPGYVLIPFDSDVVAFQLHRRSAGGLKLQVRSSLDFSTNLAESIAPFSAPGSHAALVGYRSSGGNAHLYIADTTNVYALSLNCTTAPGPAAASLSVERVPPTGSAVTVPDGGSVFIGDRLRIKPVYSPPDTVAPLLDWRLDYDFHDGNAADSQANVPRLMNADVSGSSPALPLTEYTLYGPCDPAQEPEGGSAPAPATGAGCWTSVTTNGAFGIPLGTPDFSAETPADKELKIGFEARNSYNPDSSVAVHRITFKVPQQKLASASILSGGSLTDASDGSPDTTGFKWYFAAAPVGQTGEDQLTLVPSCTGPTCVPGFSQVGSYRYWVSVPYKGGYRTPDCPGLASPESTTCTGSAAKTVAVTDVVLAMTAPSQVLVGTSTINLTSTSKQGSGVAPCPSAPGFTYDFCEVLAGACAEGAYSGSGVSVSNPFPSTGSGTVTVPTPSVGEWGLRVRYTYGTGGTCVSPKVAQWPADGGWAPVTVLQAVPSIELTNSSGVRLPKSLGVYWEATTGQGIRAYPLLDGVRDANQPQGIAWSYRVAGQSQETQISITSGSPPYGSFSISTPGDYEVILRGYGSDIVASLGVSSTGGGGGGGTLAVNSISASPSTPTVGQNVTLTCNATAGSYPISSYDWVLDSGVTRTTSSASTSYSYGTAGQKTISCTANDSSGASSSPRTGYITVLTSGGGACTMDIKDSSGARIPYDSGLKLYEASAGQPLTFVATGTTGNVSWDFGNGVFGSGATATYTYPSVTSVQRYTVRMTSSCVLTAAIDVSPGASVLDYAVTDAGTGAAVQKSGTTWVVTSGQVLKFTALNATGAVSWAFGDGETSALAAPEKTYAAVVDTTYTATLTNGTNVKSYTVSVKGSTGAPLTGNFTFRYADGTAVNRSAVSPNKAVVFTAADQATTYTWDFGDGTSLQQGSPMSHTFTRGGSFAVKVTVARTGVSGTVTTPTPLAFVVLPPPDPLLWVAGGMAYADGSGGERWQSDLSIHNPGSTAATVSLAFVPGASWDGATGVTWATLAVGPGETRSFPNVLAGFFAAAKGAWGVVLVRGDNVPVSPVIVSRTYNAASAEASGTFGLSVPAISVANGVKPQSATGGNFLAGLRHDASFRTNLTVANLKDETAEVEVVFRDAAGSVLGAPAKVTVEARGVKQLNGALSAPVATGTTPIGGAGYTTPVSHFSAEVKIKQGSGVYPYATVIDQGTGDSIVVAPAARPSTTYRLPGIVRVLGGGGAYWVSDVAVLNPTASPRKVNVTYSYVKSGAPGRWVRSLPVALKPYEQAVALDFVKVWLGLSEGDTDGYVSSFIDVTPATDDPAPSEPLVVAGKTYVPSGRGSVGLQLDAFVDEDGVGEQATRRKLVLSGLEASTKFRTNVALFLTPGSTGTIQVNVHVLDSFGRVSKTFANVGLDATNPFVQLNSADLFSGFSTDDATRATVVIDSPRGTAFLGAYATVIDQKSGDATFVAGQPAP